jgi:hypothetical protein
LIGPYSHLSFSGSAFGILDISRADLGTLGTNPIEGTVLANGLFNDGIDDVANDNCRYND